MALVGLAVVMGLYAAGKIDGFDAVLLSLFFIAVGTLWVWGFRRSSKGTVQLTHEGIFVQWDRGRTHDYQWKDIADVRLRSATVHGIVDGPWARLGRPENASFVEVKLSRSRLPIFSDRYGTLWGVRGLWPKTVRLYVTDPEGLVRAAQPFLTRSFGVERL
jgi:hypothetical protein